MFVEVAESHKVPLEIDIKRISQKEWSQITQELIDLLFEFKLLG